MRDDVLNRLHVLRDSQHYRAVLDESDVALIRQAVAERERLRAEARLLSNAALADKFGVHIRTIDRITAGENWSHVP